MTYCPKCKRETHVHHRPKTGEYWRECNGCNWKSEVMTRDEAYGVTCCSICNKPVEECRCESPKAPIIRDKEEDK